MSTKLHITQQYVYKTANNIHVNKTRLKKAKKCIRVAAQQLCDILHIKTHKRVVNPLKDTYMFTFDEQYKKFEQVLNRTQEAYDFWVSCVLSTAKEFFKVK